MGSSAEMELLVQGLRSAYHKRVARVTDIRSATRRELAELRATREAVAAQQRRWRAEYLDGLRQETGELRQATQALLGELGVAQDEMSAAQRQRLSEHADALRQDVDELRKATQAFLQERGAAQQMAASAQRRALSDGRVTLSATVRSVREAARDLLGEIDQAHQRASGAQRDWLAEERSCLVTQVNVLRGRFRREQSRIRADRAQAQSLWQGLVAPTGETWASLHEVAAVALPAPEPPLPAANAVAAAPVMVAPEESVEQSFDDLTVIPGIGPAMQRRLHRAGVETYAQLADSAPEFLRQSLGEVGQLAKVDEWITEARKLVEAKSHI